MTTFNWTITKLYTHSEQNNLLNVVYAVSWRCEGIDNSFTPPFSAITEGDEAVDEPSAEIFTQYQDLTENQIWEWIVNKIDKEEIETNLQIRITELALQRDKVAKSEPELPWGVK